MNRRSPRVVAIGRKPLRSTVGELELPDRHAGQHQHDAGEEHRHRQGPGHPVEHLRCLLQTRPIAKPLAM